MCRVILADDEYLEIQALKIIINNKFKNVNIVGEANNGEEVLTMTESLNPDIIFMDIVMPGIDGLEVSKIIKENYSDKKIILMSAYDSFELVQRALRIKVDDYLLKPIRPEKIVNILEKFIKENKTPTIENDKNLICKTDELQSVLNYIENNFRRNITLIDVSNYIKFSTTYLSKIFKKNIGINFNKYVNKRRIKEAKNLLINTNISVNDLAFDIGYNEPNYFCRVFKREEGITPLEYRKAYRMQKNILKR